MASRIPPHSLESEECLLSCCLIDGAETIGKCLEAKLGPLAFYSPANRLIWQVIVDLYRSSPPVDLLMLAAELQIRKSLESVGGWDYLTRISGRSPTTAQAKYFIEKLRQLWVVRETITEATGAIEGCYRYEGGDEELEKLLSPVANRLARAVDFIRDGAETMQKKAQKGYERTLRNLANQHDTSRQLWTGMGEFDRRFGAFDVNEEDWLIGIAAVTSGGKSAFTRKIIDHNAQAGKRGMVFLLETGLAKFLDLAAGTAARVNCRLLNQLPADHEARFRAERLERQGWVGERLWLYDDAIQVETIVSRIDDHIRQHGRIDFVVIDHLHELYSQDNFKANREAELSYIAKFLKKTAKRLDVSFFLPTQLNRSSTKDGQFRRPNKHDLRGSGELEAAFDRLLMLHIPKEDMRGTEQNDSQARVMIEVIQEKSRNGPLGKREFWFDRPYLDYVEIRDGERPRLPTGPTKAEMKGARA